MSREQGRGDYKKRGRRTLHKGGGESLLMRLAMTTASHAPDATQAVNLCDNDFVELSPAETQDAINDMGVTIPDGTKLYIAKFQGKWRIVQARVCTE